eukprot:scaffold230752_cov28-Tisochrysis_lutea.AAC.2
MSIISSASSGDSGGRGCSDAQRKNASRAVLSLVAVDGRPSAGVRSATTRQVLSRAPEASRSPASGCNMLAQYVLIPKRSQDSSMNLAAPSRMRPSCKMTTSGMTNASANTGDR